MAIACAIVALCSASGRLVLGLDFAEALFVGSWHGVASKVDCRARHPVVGLLGNSFPLSHLFERLDFGFGVGSRGETKPHGAWALAAFVGLRSALERLVVLVSDRGGVNWVFVAHILPVLSSLLERCCAIPAKQSGDFRVLVEVPLGLVISESLGAGSKSSLGNSGRRVMSSCVEDGVDVLVASGVAPGIVVVEGTLGGWARAGVLESRRWSGRLLSGVSLGFVSLVVVIVVVGLVVILLECFDLSKAFACVSLSQRNRHVLSIRSQACAHASEKEC